LKEEACPDGTDMLNVATPFSFTTTVLLASTTSCDTYDPKPQLIAELEAEGVAVELGSGRTGTKGTYFHVV